MEIFCDTCKQTVLARREARFEGFRKVGDDWICTVCGAAQAAEAKPPGAGPGSATSPPRHDTDRPSIFTAADRPERPALFTDADRPERPAIFTANERRHSCAWCRHFVLNPFAQRCGRNNRAVEATDVCNDFASH